MRHFVSDEPPSEAIQKIAGVFSSSGGDLLQVSRALVDLDAAWDPVQRKFRRPQDWFIAGLRALGATRINRRLAQVLRSLRQPMWAPPSPKGYGDTLREWGDPDSLMNRAEFARTLARRVLTPSFAPSRLLETMELEKADPISELLADSSVAADERLALALAGPAFQWR